MKYSVYHHDDSQEVKDVLPSLKPSVEKLMKSGIVYQLTCPRCSACYVAQSGCHMQTRLKEHVQPSAKVIVLFYWTEIFDHFFKFVRNSKSIFRKNNILALISEIFISVWFLDFQIWIDKHARGLKILWSSWP